MRDRQLVVVANRLYAASMVARSQARQDLAEREKALERERQAMVAKAQHVSSSEKEALDGEVSRLLEEKARLESLNRQMNNKGNQASYLCPCMGSSHRPQCARA